MEIRVLRYFLEIAREENMTRAAESLHVSQPSLSKQMKELERELGKKLFRRGSASIHLTDEGMLLRRRAEDILEMVDKTADEFKALDEVTGGDVYIGCAESYQIKHLADVIRRFRERYPRLRLHILSGDTQQVTERLDRGLLDFAVIVEPPNLARYNYLRLPGVDTFGVIMRKDSPLARKESISADDLMGLELISSPQSLEADLPGWCGEKLDALNFTGTVNLFYNGTVLVRQGLGYLLTFKHLANTGEDSELCFRPLAPTLESRMYIIWKKYQVFTPIAALLLDEIKEAFAQNE
ncbi:MAG: LysR family transcriptional regulator [Eubacteriales bacterium]|nr:LysR family transcriptional regulator [Eubacteriales bacterium]MDD3882697.1 LysR family transcriptional regulator [Eubacteriales bacterium]MDD4512731.1 LysR family transcriptional regulator [Eubacteriales bacterium]